MITKLASLYYSGNPTFTSRNVKGFNVATLEIVVADNNTFSFTTYITRDGTTPDNTCEIPTMYINREKIQKTVSLTSGTHIVTIDLTGATNIYFARSGTFTSAAINFRQSEFVEPNVDAIGIYTLNADNRILELEGGKQLDVTVSTVDGGTAKIYLEGSNDDFATYTSIRLWDSTRNYEYNDGFQANIGINHVLYANIDGYKKVRFRTEQNVGDCKLSNLVVHKELLEGRKFINGRVMYDYLNGYKYFKITMLPTSIVNNTVKTSNIKDCSAYIKWTVDGTRMNNTLKYYDRGMNLAKFPTIYKKTGQTDALARGWEILSTPCGGGYIVEFPEPISATSVSVGVAYDSSSYYLPGYICELYFSIECYTKAPEPEICLTKKYEKADYDVYELPSTNTNRDVLNDDVLEWNDTSLIYWHGGYLGVKYELAFDASHFAHFVSGEKINFAYLLPFGGADSKRNNQLASELNPSRIVVFTNTRVFCNYPRRSGNVFPNSDLECFDESTIINNEKPWFPVNDKNVADATHKYFPVLAEYNYDQFNGRVATTGDDDPYGNGGLPANTKLQDIPKSGIQFWNRLAYSSMAKGDKYCAFGNYNTVVGSEPLVMCTNDGGATWYVKAYFSCVEDYNYMYGSKVDLTPITTVSPFVANSLKLSHRKYNIPTEETKEPEVPYIISEDEKRLITAIEYDSDSNLVVTLESGVDYGSEYPVVFFENVNANSEWDYICNTGCNARGTVSTHIFFRAIKVSANKYKILANLGNPRAGNAGGTIYANQSLICRHIHAVNQVEAGCLISTGESYAENLFEGGFLYLIEQNMKNGTNVINISAGSTMGKVLRLCSSMNGVNRASGAYIFSDNDDPTLLYVSDESFVVGDNHKRYFDLPGRTIQYPTTPAGVFVGKLSDIDDQTKFKCVCELHMTMVGLLQAHGHFAGDGHNSSVCLSKDGFNWEIDVNDGSYINGADKLGNIYFGNKVAIFK